MYVIDTTRSPRSGEIDGREYNFTTRDEFLRLVAENGFLEHAQFGGNYYGTSIKAVRDVAEKGKVCVLDIEMEVRKFDFFFLTRSSFSLHSLHYILNWQAGIKEIKKAKNHSISPFTPLLRDPKNENPKITQQSSGHSSPLPLSPPPQRMHRIKHNHKRNHNHQQIAHKAPTQPNPT